MQHPDEGGRNRRGWMWVAKVCAIYTVVAVLLYQAWLIATDTIDYAPWVYSTAQLLIVLGNVVTSVVAAYRR